MSIAQNNACKVVSFHYNACKPNCVYCIVSAVKSQGPSGDSRMKKDRVYKQAEGFKRMVAQLAWRTWRTLPRQYQIWISIDDLMGDGMSVACKIISGKWFNKDKSSLCTSIYHAVHNHFLNEYPIRYRNHKRLTAQGVIPVEIVYLDDTPVESESITPLALSTSEDTIIENVLTNCFVVPILEKIYKEGSSKLQKEMIAWFLQNREKVHTKGRKFRIAAKEFRILSKEHNLTYYDTLHLFRSSACMNKLSHELLGIPYDLEYPTPMLNKEL